MAEMPKNTSPKHIGSEHNMLGQPHSQPFDNSADGPIDANYPVNNQYQRKFRASRNFKNPPQPHMCIREKTIDGQELFINVLSWTRIANPNDKNAPIPLFGGMRVPSGSPRSPPLVFAVMASPEVLKQAGRKCPDTPERMNLIDLMCEFVEEMNPGLVLSRKPEILKDRDLSGELKDVWNAVQALRDRQRAESQTQENLVLYTEFGPDSAPHYEQHNQHHHHQMQQRETVIHYGSSTTNATAATNQSAIKVSEQGYSNNVRSTNEKCDPMKEVEKISCETENMRISPTEQDVTDSNMDTQISLPTNGGDSPQSPPPSSHNIITQQQPSNATSVIVSNTTNSTSNSNTTAATNALHNNNNSTNNNQPLTSAAPAAPVTNTITAPSNKKESSNNHHHFFPKFRSSKHENHDKKDEEHNTGSGKREFKKSLNFFRRKSSPKNEKGDTKLHESHDNKNEVLSETNGKDSHDK